MLEKIFYFIMVPMVYLAIVVFVVGVVATIIRIAKAPKHKTTLKIFPQGSKPGLQAVKDTFFFASVRREKPFLWIMLILYHVAFLLLILGHLDLIPGINLMAKDSPHMLGYGAVGVTLTVSVIYFLFRRFRSPQREISSMGDYLVLLLLLFIFLTGGIISWSNSWAENGFVIEKSDFMAYMGDMVKFTFADPRDTLSGSHYFHVVMHVFLANLLIMLFPFTKFVHTFFAMALNKIRRGAHAA